MKSLPTTPRPVIIMATKMSLTLKHVELYLERSYVVVEKPRETVSSDED